MSVVSRHKLVVHGDVDTTTSNSRITVLENNEYKITYYEIVSGTSGSLTIPSQATINAGEFGLSGNAVLSKIDGSNKPTFQSPVTAGGVVVTANLTVATGAWTTSGTYTDSSVALIYSIKIKAIYYSNLTYARIIETTDSGYAKANNQTFTGAIVLPSTTVIGGAYAVGDLLYASTTSVLSKLADVAVGSYLRSGGVNTAPLWSTLILPNSATANRLVYATGANTWGDSSNMTYDGSTINFAGTGSDILTITGSGNGTQRSGIRVNASSAAGQATNYMFNDRNTTSSYGGQLYGGTTNSVGNLFGVSRADKYFIFADGASNLGMCIGTLSAQPLILGTNNTNIIQILSNGNVGILTTSSNSTLQVQGSLSLAYVAKTASYTLTISDYTVECTANTFNITLPTAVGIPGRIYNIKNSGTGLITILTTSSQTVDGNASGVLVLARRDNLTVQSDGQNWIIL